MSHCDRMVDIGRRKFLRGAGLAAAGLAVTSIDPTTAKAAPERPASNTRRTGWPTSPTSRSTSRSTSPIRTTTRPACC